MNNSQNFTGWISHQRLVELGKFYGAVKEKPASVVDAEFIQKITGTLWKKLLDFYRVITCNYCARMCDAPALDMTDYRSSN